MMDCYCDYDPPIFYSKSVVKAARKPHRCDECSRPIAAGESYERISGKWDIGYGISTFTTCSRCLDLRQWVTNNLPCFCWAHGSMLDDAKEAIDEATWRASDETRGLRFGWLRRLHAVTSAGRREARG